MQEAWAIREINDEVIKISKQFGVKNIIHYGGPGITENGEPIDNFNKYKDLTIFRMLLFIMIELFLTLVEDISWRIWRW